MKHDDAVQWMDRVAGQLNAERLRHAGAIEALEREYQGALLEAGRGMDVADMFRRLLVVEAVYVFMDENGEWQGVVFEGKPASHNQQKIIRQWATCGYIHRAPRPDHWPAFTYRVDRAKVEAWLANE